MVIRKFEELSMNAYPALSTVLLDGWILRFSNGHTKRANSANLIYGCREDMRKTIKLCEKMYKDKGLKTVFKLTEKEDDVKLDSILEGMGYTYLDKTNVMIKDIRNFSILGEDRNGFVFYNTLREDWILAYVLLNKKSGEDLETFLRMMSNLVGEAYYVLIKEAGGIVAVGMGIAEREYVGIFGICVREDMRGKGLGRRIMNNLMYESYRRGSTTAYLQVLDDNVSAKNLYRKLGYEECYSYWYRIKDEVKKI